jgi:hypothetical protein
MMAAVEDEARRRKAGQNPPLRSGRRADLVDSLDCS